MRMAKSQHGFTLLELLIASFIGVLVVLAISSLFKTGMDVTFTVTQRAETQANMRAAIELMAKDISQAGAGLPTGGLQLASGGTKSKYACDQNGICYVQNHTYPNSPSGTSNYMYGIIPGPNNGVQNGVVIPSAPGVPNASITTVYCDYSFPLTNFRFTFQNANGTQVSVTAPLPLQDPNAPTDIQPATGGGLNSGDLILFTVVGQGAAANGNTPVQKAVAVGEITGGNNPTMASGIPFAAGDPLNFNQATGNSDLSKVVTAAGGAGVAASQQNLAACRLNVVTYFLQVPAAGGTVQTPRLMRQVNGLSPVPVADNIINLQITYDLIDAQTGYLSANLADPIGAGQIPTLIQKVNLWIMGESLTPRGNKSQNMYLATSVAARDMSFCNSYSNSSTTCGN
jgi:prepilin-type N-terminal cleavage/methylation domain-containing protein